MARKSVKSRGVNLRSGEPAYIFLGSLAHGIDKLLTRQDHRNMERLPASGAALVVANHISNYDPLALGEALIWAGRWPRFLGKSDLWTTPVVGFFARGCRQIPVERHSARAVDSLAAARTALENGELVAIYPEGTITKDPLEWPMTARTGAARLALEARCPVIPVGQWGANHILESNKVHLPKFWPRKTLGINIGEPVDLSDLYDHPDRHEAVRVATERMLEAITVLVAELRGVPVPEDRFDLRKKARIPKGPTTMRTPRVGDQAVPGVPQGPADGSPVADGPDAPLA